MRAAVSLAMSLAFQLAVSPAVCGDRVPGSGFMGLELQAMQADPSSNPASLWVADGKTLWNTAAGIRQKSCADCHGDAAVSMRGVAARYPSPVKGTVRIISLHQKITECQTFRQRASPSEPENHDGLALETYVGVQSSGMPIEPPHGVAMDRAIATGRRIYFQRQGQLNLSCAQCHDQRAGQHLGGAIIPQAHPTGYPIYRLEWQTVGSLQRRLRGCISGVRAQPPPFDAPSLINLEVYLMYRARGMLLDTPAVRP